MNAEANPHHLVLGQLTDYLTGKVVTDTHDERYHQKIARYLVEISGYEPQEISCKVPLTIHVDKRKASLKIDFLVQYKGKNVMMIKYAPGSIVTRRISTLALSRVVSPYQIPYVVVTNGENAEILDGTTGRILFDGIGEIPDLTAVIDQFDTFSFEPITTKMFDQASRIAFACEVDGACPCDSDICTIDE